MKVYSIISYFNSVNMKFSLSHMTMYCFLNYFQDEYFIGSIKATFPIIYIYWVSCIHPSLL